MKALANPVDTLATDDQDDESGENERGKIQRQFDHGLAPTSNQWFQSHSVHTSSGAIMNKIIASTTHRLERADKLKGCKCKGNKTSGCPIHGSGKTPAKRRVGQNRIGQKRP